MGRAGRGRSRRRAGARVVRRFLARRALARGDGRGRATRRRRRRGDVRRRGACRSRPTSTRCSCPPASRATRPASEAGDTQLLFTGDAAGRLPDRRHVRRHLGAGRKPPAVQAERQRAPGRSRCTPRDRPSTRHPAVDRARSTAMNRRLNVLATRAVSAAAVASPSRRVSAAPSSRATPARPSSFPGPTIVATGSHARHRRHDGRDHRPRPRTARTRATPSPAPIPPSPPSTARASSPASRPARRR